ncbi:SET domain protein [Laccaria bicolor S238N-H82]|uniref:SET domain protein n=1 Tax=Laccaria bicolor (strain S238N-H82 / ATCC MYA-4686) TaxID=486041 RepID=B0CP70_LACBS|nr:SET domain protein [Laccaria bicolor S238N-H82]EDR15429.1 SET domain protein [Laccaria bicolor S238N-H82]|eukprot:XP_001873637.1 SET domain protein [Laccaria bicolor S238N-H82]
MPSKVKSQPLHWPKHIQYIISPCYHQSVTSSARQFIVESPTPAQKITQTRNCKVVIRPIMVSSHPACGQYGLFAAQKIPPKACIMDYMGEIHCDDRPEFDYDLCLHRFVDGSSIGIDASKMGNEARFINDYRGIAEKPNAIFSDTRDQGGELRMYIWSSQEIKKGDEILVSYGKSWWRTRQEVTNVK